VLLEDQAKGVCIAGKLMRHAGMPTYALQISNK
jgi:hypothetical protein